MNRKLIAIISALLLSASLFACGGETSTEETTSSNKINIETESEVNGTVETEDQTNEVESNVESETETSPASQIGDPGEYEYDERDEKVYVNNPDSEVTLRSADYKALGTVNHGTELVRLGLSKDADNYWSKVTYGGETYYIASKFLTTIKNPDEGFVEVNKTVRINDMTGSLKIRNIPAMDGSAVIGYAEAGKDIKVIAENTTTGWYKIEFVAADRKTTTGYIASDAKYFETATSEAGVFKDSAISFSFPKTWVALANGVVGNAQSGDNYTLVYADYTAEADMYFTLNNEGFAELFVPLYKTQGLDVKDYTVTQETKDGAKVAVMSFTATANNTNVYLTQYVFKTNNNKICTLTVTEVSKNTTIAEDIYSTLKIAD